MQRPAVVIVIVLLCVFAWLFHSGTLFPPPAPTPVSTPKGEFDRSWWPLAPRTLWRYEVVGKARFRTRGYYVQQVEKDGSVLVLENTDGKQSDNFRVRAGPGDRVEFKEYQAATKPVLYLPEDFSEGARWQLKTNLRAVAAGLEEIQIPVREGKVEAMRVEYEHEFTARDTAEPGWYPAGTRWFVRGIGMVREDLEGVDGPPEVRESVRRERRVMHLTGFEPSWKKKN